MEEMTLDEYQYKAGETAVYPGRISLQGLIYTGLGLAGESGELSNTLKKILRDDKGVLTNERKTALIDEASDVLWYLSQIAEELGVGLGYIAQRNLAKLRSRQERGVIGGSGSER